MSHSIRQRATFKAVDEDEDGPARVLDEQEQEEIINDVRKESETKSRQYGLLLIGVVGLSATLQLIYLLNPTRESPFAVIIPPPPHSTHHPIPGSTLFTLLALLLHANIVLQLLPPSHSARTALSHTYIPLSHLHAITLSALAPVFALVLGQSWADILWWSSTAGVSWLAWSAKRWMSEEEREIENLEGMRYDAKGA